MRISELDRVLVEVGRFVESAKALKKSAPSYTKGKKSYAWDVGPSPESASVRRASMDLTKALARLRKTQGGRDA